MSEANATYHECGRCGEAFERLTDYSLILPDENCQLCEAIENEKWDDQDEAVTHELRTARGY